MWVGGEGGAGVRGGLLGAAKGVASVHYSFVRGVVCSWCRAIRNLLLMCSYLRHTYVLFPNLTDGTKNL